MLNKRKRYNTTNINSFINLINKLDNLKNLTNNNLTNDNLINNNLINNKDKISTFNKLKDELKTEKDIEKEIDKIVKRIEQNFTLNNYDLTNFSGKSFENKYEIKRQIDPNEYDESILSIPVNKQYKHFQNNINIKKPLIKINIDAEINNISDIIELANKYNLDPEIEYNINMKLIHTIKEPLIELNNMIGLNQLKTNIVDQILYFIQELHKNKNNEKTSDFMHTVIYGPPGTGKTEVAKLMGKIYSKMGILSKGTFKKVTRSDLVAGYLGQTALKTQDVIKESLGGVLFIDEAYALGNPEKRDSFSKECIDTLCEGLSDNKDNLMVIIAGYEDELNTCFFSYNQGLDSRFTWRFKTDDYSAEDLHKILRKKINDIGWSIDESNELQKITDEWFKKNKNYFRFYGRDMETLLAKAKIVHGKRVFCKAEDIKKKINLQDLNKALELFINNSDIKKKREEEENKKYIYSSLYS